jgi:predicted nucleic acid-binding protein
MKVLLDTDVILDVLLDRQPFSVEATNIWDGNHIGRFEGFVSPITPVNVFYIVRKIKGKVIAQQAVQELLAAFQVCTVDKTVMLAAQALSISDYEDAVQHASAEANQLDVIVTRNLKDYAGATLPVFSPGDFLKQLASTGNTP